MVDDFLLTYSSRKLGRDLTKSEIEEIEDFVTRRQVRDWVMAKAKAKVEKKVPKRTYKKKESVKDEQSIVDESVEEEADTSSE